MKEKNQNILLYLSILSVFVCANCTGAIDGALSKLAEALNVSQTTALYVGSYAALASMISSLLCGMVLGKKLSYKIAAIFCTTLAIIGGLIFPLLYCNLKRNSLSVFLLIGATGVFISGIAKNIFILALGFLLGGIGNACMMAGVMAILGVICQPEQVAFASSLMMAFFNLDAFLCSSWESFLGSITGDSLYTPLYVGAVTFVIIAIILFIKSPIPKDD